MYYSYTEYTGDGVTSQFTVGFPYLSKDDVYVYVNNKPVSFTWINDTIVKTDVPPEAGAVVKVARSTRASSKLVEYQPTGLLRPSDLNKTNDQLLYLAQELIDHTEDAPFDGSQYARKNGKWVVDVQGYDTTLYNFMLSNHTDLATVVSEIGYTKADLWIDKNTTLTDDLTIPSNINLRFMIGNTIGGPHSLTIEGGIDAGPYQIFEDTLTSISIKQTDIKPEWFGGLAEAITALGTAQKTIIIDRDVTLSADLIIPSNIGLVVRNGVTIDGSYTLTINGPFKGSDGCFGSSIVVKFIDGSIDAARPEWWGTGNGSDEKAFLSAIASMDNPVIKLSNKTYYISAEITSYKNLVLTGVTGSTISWVDGGDYQILHVVGASLTCQNVRFIGGTAESNHDDLTIRAIHIEGPTIEPSLITNCRFDYFQVTGISLYSSALKSAEIYNVVISDNTFITHTEQLQSITCFGGNNVTINSNVIYGGNSIGILCDDATNSTALADYARLRNFIITDNIVYMPQANNSETINGIQAVAVEGLTITNNIVEVPNGIGIRVQLYDLAQQANAPGGGAAYLPISEDKARTNIESNVITECVTGIQLWGYSAPIISGNNIICSSKGIDIKATAGNVDGTAYSFPTSSKGNALVLSNMIKSINSSVVGISLAPPKNFSQNNVFVGDFSKRYETTDVANLSDQHINDGDRDLSYATVYDRHINNLIVDQQIAQSSRTIRFITEASVPTNIATTIATIKTTDEDGNNDGGGWACFMNLLVSAGASPSSSNAATKSQCVMFNGAQNAYGTSSLSPVTTISTTSSAATNSNGRDVGTITVSLKAVDNYTTEIQATVDFSGSGSGNIIAIIDLVYKGYLTAPTIS